MKRGWLAGIILVVLGAGQAAACTVPVFRYALERWPSSPHVVNVTSNRINMVSLNNLEHDANAWIVEGSPDQTNEVQVVYADVSHSWYDGPYDPGLIMRLTDSPLRRQIAHELLTGTTAAFVLIESSNVATNEAAYAMIKERLADLAQKIELPDQPDYEDEADGYGGPSRGKSLCSVPIRVSFSLHRVPRDSQEELYLVRQVVGIDPSLADPAQILLGVVFGRGRVIPISGEDVNPDVIEEVCRFLCEPCSCRVKSLNPGVDLLMTANWEESLYRYPEAAATVFLDKSEATLGGTGVVVSAAATLPAETPVRVEPATTRTEAATPPRTNLIPLLSVLAACVVVGLLLLFRKGRA